MHFLPRNHGILAGRVTKRRQVSQYILNSAYNVSLINIKAVLRVFQVWKRQEAAKAEARKAEELKKALEEERKNQEYMQMAETAGHVK